LFSVVSASCSTLGLAKSKSKDHPKPEIVTETVIQTETEYLPPRTVIQPFPKIPREFPQEVPFLSDEYLTGSGNDITGVSAVGVGVNWAYQYHELGEDYLAFVNWYKGLIAGQQTTQDALDEDFKGPIDD